VFGEGWFRGPTVIALGRAAGWSAVAGQSWRLPDIELIG
jgi:hypothetical protein